MCIRDSIKPNTEYYYNGTHWMINYLSANNIEANSITADLIDAKNLTITDGEFISKTTNGLVTTSTAVSYTHLDVYKRQLWLHLLKGIQLKQQIIQILSLIHIYIPLAIMLENAQLTQASEATLKSYADSIGGEMCIRDRPCR